MISLIVISYAYQKGWIGRCVIVSAVLYLLGLLGNSYYFLVVGTKIQWVVDQYLSIFVSTRNEFGLQRIERRLRRLGERNTLSAFIGSIFDSKLSQCG